jgi:tetratricopeptide (TPR) repeat protein
VGAEEESLPAWARPYLPAFQRLRHALELSEGFILMPIEVPGIDVATALGEWLTRAGHPAVVIDGRSATRPLWGLLDVSRAPEGVVVMVGAEDERARAELRLLNQHRDRIARAIDGPLLWCGARGFLDLTWRSAPDFWSVADVPRRIARPAHVLPKGSPATYKAADNAQLGHAYTLYQQAVKQGDVSNAARLGLVVAEIMMGMSGFTAAQAMLDECQDLLRDRGDHVLQARVLLLRGRAELITGALSKADADLTEALRLSSSSGAAGGGSDLEADIQLALGNLCAQTGRGEEAKELYEQAWHFYRQGSNTRKMADTIVALADLQVLSGRHDEAEIEYDRAIAMYEQNGCDHASLIGKANALKAKGELHAGTDRLREAEAAYTTALSIYRDKKATAGEATTLAALGDLYAKIDRIPDAVESYEEAISILHKIGFPEWEARVNDALTAVRARLARSSPP